LLSPTNVHGNGMAMKKGCAVHAIHALPTVDMALQQVHVATRPNHGMLTLT
jgi:hypothetical protein